MLGEDYADLIVFYLNNPKRLERFQNADIEYMNEAFAIVHIPVAEITSRTVSTLGYSVLPKLYGLTSEVSIEASGVDRIRNIPALNLRGTGTLIGIIDTGIDYTNPVFLRPDGSTKIVRIWDQTIETGVSPYETHFGTEYNSDQINEALAAANPLEIVPSMDDNGHGTMLAGIAAGNDTPQEDFYGVAPEAQLVIVKLRQAKKYLRDFYVVPDNITCFQESDIMWGLQYCVQLARDLNMPITICLGSGTSQGSHDGRSPLSILLSIIGDFPRTAVVTPVGNEGNRARHYYNNIEPSIGSNTVELNVGEGDEGFSMELWGTSPGIYSIDILSPDGEYIPRIAASMQLFREISFIFGSTIIYIDYLTTESESGDQLILLRFHNITAGVWRFNVYGQGDLPLSFHIWLPMGDMITNETYFIQPNIYTTILAPSTASVPISMTAYNPLNNGLYVNASRGYTITNIVKPELAAPGVNYIAPNLNKEFSSFSGTSVAAAHTAGIIALFLEWGIVRGNQPGIDTVEIKNYLIRGARRNPNINYPNRDWGYGILDIFNVFDVFRADTG